MKYILYCTTNIVNKFIYVGWHKTENPYEFDGYLGNGLSIKTLSRLKHPKTKFEYAVKEFGYKNFIRNTLFIVDTLEEVLDLEAAVVNEEFLKRPDVYNMALGGIAGFDASIEVFQYDKEGNFIKAHHSQTEAGKAVNRSQASIWKAVAFKTKCADCFWTKEKFDKIDPNTMHDYTDKRCIPIFQYSEDGTYDCSYESIKDAARVLGISDSNIGVALKLGRMCNHKYFSLKLYPKLDIKTENKKQERGTLIYQYDLEGNFISEYKGMPAAKKALGIKSDIYKAIKMGRTAGGFQWSFQKFDKIAPVQYKSGKAKKIGKYDENWNLLIEYSSLTKCKEAEGSGVIHVLNGRDEFHKGYRYKYI